jgi:hypothetical protein
MIDTESRRPYFEHLKAEVEREGEGEGEGQEE